MNRPDPALLPALPAFEGMDDNDSMVARIDYGTAVADAYGFASIWSEEALDFAQIAFMGTWRVSYSGHWGPDDIVSASLQDPTWLDLFAAADWAIARSGDSHHIFIERFDPAPGGFLDLITGS